MMEAKTPRKKRDTRWDKRGKVRGRVNKRDLKAMIRLQNQGSSDISIAKELKWDIRTVRKHLGSVGRRELTEKLCPCLTNPHLELPNRYATYPLELHEQDWRLDPITWFYLCTPDFSEEGMMYWEDKFVKQLKRSSFWNHYQKLKIEVYRLQKDYENSAPTLADEDRNIWQQIQGERNEHFLPSRVPISLEPDWDQWEPYYDREYCDRVIRVFNDNIDDLTDRLCGLEELLQQLNGDLIIKGA